MLKKTKILRKELYYTLEPWIKIVYSDGNAVHKRLSYYLDEPVEDAVDTHVVYTNLEGLILKKDER